MELGDLELGDAVESSVITENPAFRAQAIMDQRRNRFTLISADFKQDMGASAAKPRQLPQQLTNAGQAIFPAIQRLPRFVAAHWQAFQQV